MTKIHSIAHTALWLAVLALNGGLPALGASVATGDLLVAADNLRDPNFSRAVVLVVRHGDSGSLGLVLSRPLGVRPSDVLPGLPALNRYRGPLYSGGPVMPFGILALIRADNAPADTDAVGNDIWVGSVDALETALDSAESDARTVRIYAGHAGWRPGQLAQEIAEGAWHVVPADPAIVFSPQPEEIWRLLRPEPLLRADRLNEIWRDCIQMLRCCIQDSETCKGTLSWGSHSRSRISPRPTITAFAPSITSI